MKRPLYAILSLFLSFQLIYSQGTGIPGAASPSDTAGVNTHIHGELSIMETLGGRISGSSFHGDDAFTATTIGADFYLMGGLTFGPEFGIFIDGATLPLFGLNLGYTHWLSERRGFYARAGFHIAAPLETRNSTNSRKIVTTAVGMKFPMGTRSLFRVELNYRHQWRKNTPPVYILPPTPFDSGGSYSEYQEYSTKGSIGILIGFSAAIR